MRTGLAILLVVFVPIAAVGCDSGSKKGSPSAGSAGSTAGSGGGAGANGGSTVVIGGRGGTGGTGATGGDGGDGTGDDPPAAIGCPEPGVLLARIPSSSSSEYVSNLAVAGGQVFFTVSVINDPLSATMYSIPTNGGTPAPFTTGTRIEEVAADATDVFWMERDQCCGHDINSTIWKKPIATGPAVRLESGIVHVTALALSNSDVIYAHDGGGVGGAGGGSTGLGGADGAANGGLAGRGAGGDPNPVTNAYAISRVSKTATVVGTSARVVTVPSRYIPFELALGQSELFFEDDDNGDLMSVVFPGPAIAPTRSQVDPVNQYILAIATSGADVFAATYAGLFKRTQAGGSLIHLRSLNLDDAVITVRSLLVDGSSMFWLEEDKHALEFPTNLMRASTDGSGIAAMATRFNPLGLAQDLTSVYLINETTRDGYVLCKISKGG